MATTTFFASLVEFVEALTIVLAVGVTRNWRSAFAGTIAAVVALAALIFFSAPAIQKVPIEWMQLGIGAVVAIFGFRWLKKATLRSAGRIPMHDEDLEYSKEVETMKHVGVRVERFESIAMLTTFKAVFLEGFEVAFIIMTAGNVSGHFGPSVAGASAALLLVICVGFFIHRPLSRVPENSLKKTVGVMLVSFGVFWFGEGLGFHWPFEDGAIIGLALVSLIASLSVTKILRRTDPAPRT